MGVKEDLVDDDVVVLEYDIELDASNIVVVIVVVDIDEVDKDLVSVVKL